MLSIALLLTASTTGFAAGNVSGGIAPDSGAFGGITASGSLAVGHNPAEAMTE